MTKNKATEEAISACWSGEDYVGQQNTRGYSEWIDIRIIEHEGGIGRLDAPILPQGLLPVLRRSIDDL